MQRKELIRGNFFGYRIESLDRVAGHDIVRLLPYHCELNPIEMVWGRVKGYIAANNPSFTLAEIERRLHEVITLVTRENGVQYCAHVERLEKQAWEQNSAFETRLENVVVPVGSEFSAPVTTVTAK